MTMNVNSGKPWSPLDVYDLRQGLGHGTPIEQVADFLSRGRTTAEEFVAMRNCGVDADAITRRSAIPRWSILHTFGPGQNGIDEQRVRVYDFERDATARVFAIKEHRALPATSRCADGTWSHANGVLQFSAPIPLKPPGKPAVPRTLRY